MKASEIITDDIVSREKHKTRDVVGKKTTSQDYFGNRADKQKDRDLVSKDKSKESKKEWFEEGEDPCWKYYKQVGMKKKNGRKVPNCVPKEDIEEGWKQNLAGAALAGAAALGGGMAHAAPADASNAAIVKSLVNPQAQQRFAAQHADTTAKLTDPRYDHNPNALAKHAAHPKELHAQWIENLKNAAQFDNPYQIIRTAINMAGVTPKEVLQNLPKGYKLPTTEPTGTYVPRGTPRTAGVDEGSMQAAAHKKSGPKFGGYYGATQKGPPKAGQGFGGAAESTDSKISIKGKK
jgi:hypothetical protein